MTDKEGNVSFFNLASSRFSVRKYDGRHVKKNKLKKILEAGRIAPTAKNIQPQKIYVIQSEEGIKKINDCCQCIYGAKTVLLVCYDKNIVWKNQFNPEITSGDVDCSIVLTHMMLEAQDQGVNSCWVAYFDHDLVSKTFELPQNIVPVAIMPMGYGCEGVVPTPNHSNKKPLEEMIVNV